MNFNKSLVWFGRDPRDYHRAALAAVLEASGEVHCASIFDREIPGALPSCSDCRDLFGP